MEKKKDLKKIYGTVFGFLIAILELSKYGRQLELDSIARTEGPLEACIMTSLSP
jgi:hypothetical protein